MARYKPIMHGNHHSDIPKARRDYFAGRCERCKGESEIVQFKHTENGTKEMRQCKDCGYEFAVYK